LKKNSRCIWKKPGRLKRQLSGRPLRKCLESEGDIMGPLIIANPSDVQFYSSLEKELKHSQIHTARQFIKFNCIEYDREHRLYKCKPIPGYNSTTYFLVPNKNAEGGYECNCQHFQTQKKKNQFPLCSHILALHYNWDATNRLHGVGRHESQALLQVKMEV
jgi:hypothetical protein